MTLPKSGRWRVPAKKSNGKFPVPTKHAKVSKSTTLTAQLTGTSIRQPLTVNK